MIKITSQIVYEPGDTVCAACGRTIGDDKYERVEIIKMDKCKLVLCDKCAHSFKRILDNHLKHR